MIQCPNCSKDIADDTAHCGFCGAKIETGSGMKTMMGFAAMTGDTLKQAAEEARKAREAAQQERSERRPSVLPQRPSANVPAADGKPKLPQLPRPTPSAGTAAASLSIDGQPDPVESDAKTAVMGAVGGAPSTVEEGAIEVGDTEPAPYRGAEEFEPKTEPNPPAAETKPEVATPSFGHSGPTDFGGATGADRGGPSEFGSGKMNIAQETLPAKKKTNPAIFLVIGIVLVMLMCCVAWMAYGFIYPLILAM